MVVVTGFALPIVLAHSEIINTKASVMAIAGGGCVTRPNSSSTTDYGFRLVYGTILAYSTAFSQESDYD